MFKNFQDLYYSSPKEIKNQPDINETVESKLLLLRCQQSIQELQRELERNQQEKRILYEKNEMMKTHLEQIEKKFKEEQYIKEKFQGFI